MSSVIRIHRSTNPNNSKERKFAHEQFENETTQELLERQNILRERIRTAGNESFKGIKIKNLYYDDDNELCSLSNGAVYARGKLREIGDITTGKPLFKDTIKPNGDEYSLWFIQDQYDDYLKLLRNENIITEIINVRINPEIKLKENKSISITDDGIDRGDNISAAKKKPLTLIRITAKIYEDLLNSGNIDVKLEETKKEGKLSQIIIPLIRKQRVLTKTNEESISYYLRVLLLKQYKNGKYIVTVIK